MKMTKEELAAKLEAHAKWLKTRYTEHIEGERANLACAELSCANLTYAKFTDANLAHAKLTGANLTGANLTDVNLTGANLTGANLNISSASPLVYDALVASLAAQMALNKTRTEWEVAK